MRSNFRANERRGSSLTIPNAAESQEYLIPRFRGGDGFGMYNENQCELRVASCALLLSPCFTKRNSQPATDNENQFLNRRRLYGQPCV